MFTVVHNVHVRPRCSRSSTMFTFVHNVHVRPQCSRSSMHDVRVRPQCSRSSTMFTPVLDVHRRSNFTSDDTTKKLTKNLDSVALHHHGGRKDSVFTSKDIRNKLRRFGQVKDVFLKERKLLSSHETVGRRKEINKIKKERKRKGKEEEIKK